MRSVIWIAAAVLFLIPESHALASPHRTGTASWYSSADACGPKTNDKPGCPTASGKGLYALEKNGEDFAAMWNVPLGSRVRVCNERNGKCVIVRVWDRGPNKRLGRVIDLSRKSFNKISEPQKGIINVSAEVL
jgi:rare lipoprotein A